MKAKIKENVLSLKKYWQILYAILLILLVPVAIGANTLWVTRSFRSDVDSILQRQALGLAEVFNGAMQDDLKDAERLQTALNRVSTFNPEIRLADVLVPEGEEFRVIASLSDDNIGKKTGSFINVQAWYQKRAFATLTTAGLLSQNDPLATRKFEDLQERFWSVTVPLFDANGDRVALLSLKLSLSFVDSLVQQTLLRSYLILTLALIIVIALLVANTRLFEYALLAKKLKEVEQLKDEFISMASHELRTPITSLRGYLSLLEDGSLGPLPDLAKEKVTMMLGSSERLSELVEDLLNVSRIEQGRLSINLERVELIPLIEGVMAELMVQAQQKSLDFVFEKPDAPLPELLLDPQRTKQVLVNIIGNAIKYTPKGSVKVTTKIIDDGKHLEIRCADTGMGMTQKEREKLFQKFYRVKSNSAESIKGTGLGLWITHQLIELMAGVIEVDSIKGVGTQMAIVFPIYTPAETSIILKKQEARQKEEAKSDNLVNPYPPRGGE